jgi:hypothetical protein
MDQAIAYAMHNSYTYNLENKFSSEWAYALAYEFSVVNEPMPWFTKLCKWQTSSFTDNNSSR